MSSQEPTQAYVYQPIGSIEAGQKGIPSDRLWGVGMPYAWARSASTVRGLTREEAKAVADAINAIHLPTPPTQGSET